MSCECLLPRPGLCMTEMCVFLIPSTRKLLLKVRGVWKFLVQSNWRPMLVAGPQCIPVCGSKIVPLTTSPPLICLLTRKSYPLPPYLPRVQVSYMPTTRRKDVGAHPLTSLRKRRLAVAGLLVRVVLWHPRPLAV